MKNILLFSIFIVLFSCTLEEEMQVEEEISTITQSISITGNSVLDFCDNPSGNYDFTIEVKTEDGLQDIKDFTGTSSEDANLETTVTGNSLEVLIQLNNFDLADASNGRGSGYDDIVFNYLGHNNDILFQENLGSLFICTDSFYELIYTFNFEDNTSNIEVKIHGF